ncbi:ornithine aminomutase subunit alpha [Fusibacter paucivorans]|uniref:Ornithine aminomutase subunit alpha n=1 Tax=Fusibacter paucivorans TaxID=76009 RepID=A0ABS5PT56_9FIRM|nr:ornithine aminomutase subunit alpha [Fusibacter paucivorans]MBS7527746.1 ornithine aminomutase subunit alpha [Fusibacter paucivorans]
MNQYTKREDDFENRRTHLAQLTESEVEARFWSLLDEIVSPLLTLAKTHTSPSIERSVLLRMGFSSLEAKPLVEEAIRRNLVGHGVGHLVYYKATQDCITIREAGLAMLQGNGWEALEVHFGQEVAQ